MSTWSDHLQTRLSDWRKQGLARNLKIADGSGTRFTMRGKQVLSFASNDYLDLAAYPEVIAAAKTALELHGAGSGASPLIVGHKTEHAKLEAALAVFKQSEAALVFASGFHAALATLGALAGENDTIILDRLSHASLIDGAKASDARVRVFKHNDVDDLRQLLASEAEQTSPPAPLLKEERGERRLCIVAIESLYSMDGDQAPLAEIVNVCKEAGALLLVDEAHATGVLGETGRGALEAITKGNGTLPAHVIAMGTLSKALGSQGGYVCASQLVIDTIVHAGRAYLFSTALNPAAAGAARAALEIVDTEPERRAHLIQLANSLRAALNRLGFEVVPGNGPIIAVLTGEEKRATKWSDALLEKGIYVPAIRFPTVKKGQARLRISVSAAHTREDCQTLTNALKALKSEAS